MDNDLPKCLDKENLDKLKNQYKKSFWKLFYF